MHQSIYQKNLKIEAQPEAMTLLKAWQKKHHPGSQLITVNDAERQLKGIDFILSTEEGELINIDIKVRNAADFPARYWNNDPEQQDILLEYKQGESAYGWANLPTSETDLVIHIFTGLTPEHLAMGFRNVVTIPHETCRLLTTRSKLVLMQNKYRSVAAHNGYTTTYCLAIPCNRIPEERERFTNRD